MSTQEEDLQRILSDTVLDLADHFGMMDDGPGPFGVYPRVTYYPEEGRLVVMHDTENFGIEIDITPFDKRP